MIVLREKTACKYTTDKIIAKNAIKVWREKKYSILSNQKTSITSYKTTNYAPNQQQQEIAKQKNQLEL